MTTSTTIRAYPEIVTLRDGRTVALGPVTRASKPLIAGGMLRLSPESSRRRFFTVRYRLSDDELERMTALDGVSAFAIGASARDPERGPIGVGVARYARDADDPTAAEMAIAITDDYQGQGLGRIMIERLVVEARARGIERLRATMLPDNDVVTAMLRKYAPDIEIRFDGEHRSADISTRLAGTYAGQRLSVV